MYREMYHIPSSVYTTHALHSHHCHLSLLSAVSLPSFLPAGDLTEVCILQVVEPRSQ
jgi:hypothetical protein